MTFSRLMSISAATCRRTLTSSSLLKHRRTVLHGDKLNPNVLHLYLLSYERHSLIAHYVIALDDRTSLAHREQTPDQPGYTRTVRSSLRARVTLARDRH